jgi:hypothetical protein
MMMMKRIVFVWSVCAAVTMMIASTAHAQYGTRPLGSTAVGEKYNVELGVEFWTPSRDIQIASESLGIVGTTIDAVTDLGFEKETFRDWRLVLRPSKKFKFRLGYTPIRYQAEATLERTIIFNGQQYSIGLPVNTDFDWKAWRFGLEYDFVYGSHGFAGFITEVKYTDVHIDIVTPVGSLAEFTDVKAPIPTIGGIGRVYVAKNVSVTGEVTGLKLTYNDNEGKYLDFDLYGTVNFNNSVGAQVGYRRIKVDYDIDEDLGDFDLKGFYVGGVVRF